MMYRHLAKEVMIKSFSGWTKDQQKNCLVIETDRILCVADKRSNLQ